jgi:hypothetical protein
MIASADRQMAKRQFQFEVERVLAEQSLDYVQALADAGCDRTELLSLLELEFWTHESWSELVGMDLRAFKVLISEIRNCAGRIKRLEESELMYHLRFELPNSPFERLREQPVLSTRLREFASLLDAARAQVGPKRRPRLNAWKARVVATVSTRVGRVCDREVSAIISAILQEPNYTEKAHQTWRLKHAGLIAKAMRSVRDRRRPGVVASNPS